MKKTLLVLCLSLPLFADVKHLSLPQAIKILKHDNLELKIAKFNARMKKLEAEAVQAKNYGRADLTIAAIRSNDALNVFGFKLQSREATFADFGFRDFLNPLGQAIYGASQGVPPSDMSSLLQVQPDDLNYPGARNHFQTKLSYKVPLYTGGKLTEYGRISNMLYQMSLLDRRKLFNAKVYETKKAFYDISLVENYIVNLRKIIKNISTLENVVKSMQKEGYAKETDLFEVQARKAEAQSMYNQAKLNRELAYQFLSFLLNTEVRSIRHVNESAPMPRVSKSALAMNNLDIQKAELGLQIANHAMDLEKSRYLPEVGAFAEYGSADNHFWNDFTGKDAYTVGVQMKWNLFSGGEDEKEVEKARLKYLKTKDQVALARKGIALKVKKLRTEILSINSDIHSYRTQLKYARRVYENYKTRYEEGMVSISDVLIKQSKELEMLLKLLGAKNKRNTKIFELDSILNRGGEV